MAKNKGPRIMITIDAQCRQNSINVLQVFRYLTSKK